MILSEYSKRSVSRLVRRLADAVRSRRMGSKEPQQESLRMTYDDFRSLCVNRRSIRYFLDRPVAQEDIRKLMELARMAPSVGNLQPWRFHIVMNRALRRDLERESLYGNFVTGAGVFLVVTSNRAAGQKALEPVWNEKELEYSCMAAMTNIMLGATAMGLGTCWVSLHRGDVHDVLKLPPQEMVIGGLMIGHYRAGEEQASGEHQRKPLADVCKWYG
jgi:nitroreductase